MISVITLTFNNYEQLRATLRSLENVPTIESIVINGGSCHKTTEFLKTYSGHSVSELDHGIADAFNKGISLAKGEGITFLNSGDLLEDRQYYSDVQKLFETDPQVDFVYSDLWIDGKDGETQFRAVQKPPFNMGKGMPFPHPTLVVRQKVFQKIGGFNTDYRIAMDFEWVLRMLLAFNNGKYLPNTPIRMDDAGVSITQETEALLECKKALIQHHQFRGPEKLYFYARRIKFLVRCGIRKSLGEKALKAAKKMNSPNR